MRLKGQGGKWLGLESKGSLIWKLNAEEDSKTRFLAEDSKHFWVKGG